MTPAPARLGIWFALTLALPAAFAGVWVWLLPGGVVTRTRAGELRAAEAALAAATTALAGELQQAAGRLVTVLQLDGERRVIAPFQPLAATTPTPIVIAEAAAGSRLVAGDVAGALPFFVHAAAAHTLSPEGWLAYANARAATDADAARTLLTDAQREHGAAVCGGIPFAVLLLLTEARWPAAATSPARRHELAARSLALATTVPAAVYEVVADELVRSLPELRDDASFAALRVAAATALRHRDAPASSAFASGPAASVLVPLPPDRLAVVPAKQAEVARDRAFAAARAAQPTVRVAPVRGDSRTDGSPTLEVPALAETWTATDAATPTSALLHVLANTSLALSVLTLVLGNLLLWRSTRRELALVRMRADFVDVVSHELRTPLAALSIEAEMLAAGDVPADRVPHYLQALRADVKRLADQVERILDFGRLEKGAGLRRERLPARAVLARGLRAGRPALRLVDQQLTVQAPRTLPAIVGDVDVLARALRNLLENAAKYAPAGSTVAVRAFADHGEVVIEVADRGPGVPAGERAAVFQPFVRGGGASPGTPGSGLGLALVAAAAKVHAGRVEVSPRDGGGAVFTLRLPAAKGAAS